MKTAIAPVSARTLAMVRKGFAFTPIELLVVIAIIANLPALLLSSPSMAKEKAPFFSL